MELRDYLNVIRARRGVIILATAIVIIVALALSLVQEPVYQAQTKVLISETDTGAALLGTVLPELSSQPERALQTQVQLIEVRPVAEGTVRRLGLQQSPDDLLQRVTVSAVGQTNVIVIEATAPSAVEARDIADTMAQEYVAASQERKRASIRAAADEVEQRLDETRKEIIALGERISDSGRSNELATELTIVTDTYSTLAEKYEQLRINEQLEGGSGTVVESAIANDDPISPNIPRNVGLGAVVGLVFGLGMAFLGNYLDDTIKSSEEAEKVYGAAVLGIVPAEKSDKTARRRLTIVEAPGSAAAEAYRVIRNSLDFINFENNLKTLMITSAAPAEGKSTVAANLAISLAQSGKKVVLVSCDFRRHTVDQFFEVTNEVGLSEVLLGTHALKSALQRPRDEHLLILTAGKMPPNPNELLGSSKMKDVLDSLSEWADWVIVDTPPVLAVADPISVARWADGVLMVSKAGSTTTDAAARAVELLGKVGARIIGVAVWGLDESRNALAQGYGYGHYTGGYYYYRSYYSKAPASTASTDAGADWVPPDTAGRRIARVALKVLSVGLSVLVVVALALVAVYFMDQYFGWGLVDMVRSVTG